MLRLYLQVSHVGMLQVLSGTFVSGGVIFFSALLGGAAMGVGGEVAALRGYLL